MVVGYHPSKLVASEASQGSLAMTVVEAVVVSVLNASAWSGTATTIPAAAVHVEVVGGRSGPELSLIHI